MGPESTGIRGTLRSSQVRCFPSMTRRSKLSVLTASGAFCCSRKPLRVSSSSIRRRWRWLRQSILQWKGEAKLRERGPTRRGRGAKEWCYCPAGICSSPRRRSRRLSIEFGPPHSRSRGLVRGGALADGERWPIKKGHHHRFVALAIWLPDKILAKTCADFSDLEIGPDGCLYLLSDKSSTIARLDDLPAGGGTAALLDAWRLGDLDGKPEGLAFTVQGRAIVGLDTRKPRRNLVLLEPPVAPPRGRGQSLS